MLKLVLAFVSHHLAGIAYVNLELPLCSAPLEASAALPCEANKAKVLRNLLDDGTPHHQGPIFLDGSKVTLDTLFTTLRENQKRPVKMRNLPE